MTEDAEDVLHAEDVEMTFRSFKSESAALSTNVSGGLNSIATMSLSNLRAANLYVRKKWTSITALTRRQGTFQTRSN